ncbi:MAG: hypothetical protein RRC34_15845 [Lentisphaeria bacterium]|nr:hypothetical protein [Lentisphaeria bacterium]
MAPFSFSAAGSAPVRPVIRLWRLVIGLTVSFFPLSRAWDDWRAVDAAVRFRLARPPRLRQSYTLRMDIDEAFSKYAVRGAYSATGAVLPTRPIRLGEALIAVEIGLSPQESGLANHVGAEDKTKFPDHTPVFLYLTAAGKDSPPTISTSAPIACHTGYLNAITRPGDVTDLFTFWSRMPSPAFRGDLGLTDDPARYISQGSSRRSSQREKRHLTQLAYSASLMVKEKGVFRFGVEAADTAWFVFVNGEGVAAWGTGTASGGAVLGRDVTLSPGIHELSLLTVSRAGEAFPRPVYSVNGGPPAAWPPARLTASHMPPAVRLEYQRGDVHPGVAIDGGVVYSPSLDGMRHVVTTTDLTWVTTRGAGPRKTVFTLKDGGTFAGDTAVVTGSAPRRLALSGPFPTKRFTVGIPVFPRRPAAVVMAELVLERLPPMVPKTGRVDLIMAVRDTSINEEATVPGFDPVARVETVDGAGKLIHGFDQALPEQGRFQTVTVSVTPAVEQIVLSASLAGTHVVRPVIIDVLRPTSDVSRLVADGDRLRSGDHLAMLHIDGDSSSPAPMPVAAQTLPDDATVIWVDTYLAKGAGGERLSRRLSSRNAGSPYMIHRLDDRDLPTSPVLPELRQFHLGARALSMKPGGIIWGVGLLDLEAGTHRDDIQRRQRFFARASMVRGIIPVLVTSPPSPSVDHEESRAAALSLKRLGLKLGVPVVDVYSEARALTSRGPEVSFTGVNHVNTPVDMAGARPAERDWYLDSLIRSLRNISEK